MGVDRLSTKYKDVMIDFETLGSGAHGGTPAPCSVAAVFFDKDSGDIGSTIKINMDADTFVRDGVAEIDAKTVYWWLEQSDKARKSLLENKSDGRFALNQLNEFIRGADRIWSHATFDFVIFVKLLNAYGIKPSFSYRAGMDIRTLVFLAPQQREQKREGTHHDALDDCIHQVKYTVAALNSLKK